MVADGYHRECGIHSGIPECCVDWYLGPWTHTVADIPYLWSAYWKANNVPTQVEYIRCPVCIESSIIITLKECNCESQ